MDSLPPWRPLLRAALQREGRSSNSRWLQLATVASDGTPRVRTLVFRGWSAPAVLDLFTDGRSDKASELRNLPDAEICWLLPRARSQFRLRSRFCQLPAAELLIQRQHHWQSLTPSARETLENQHHSRDNGSVIADQDWGDGWQAARLL